MIVENILKDLTIINSEDKILGKKDLINVFESQISSVGFTVNKWLNIKKSPYELIITDCDENLYHIILYLKNISSAGWASKPNIKRVQVSNIKTTGLDNFIHTTLSQTNLILGVYDYDNNPIFVGWDAYRYVTHKTIRSCYINTETLVRGYKEEYLVTVNSSQKVWVFIPKNFGRFLKDYITYNKNRNEQYSSKP